VCSRRSFCWQWLQATQKGHTKGTCTVGLQTAAVIDIWHRPKVKVCSAGDYWNSEGCVDRIWFVQHWCWVQHVEGYNWNYWLGKKCIYVHMYLYNYLHNPCSTVVAGKLTVSQLVKKFLEFYETRKFITAFTSASHLSLSWARSIQSTYYSYFLNSNFNMIRPSTPGYYQWCLSLRFPHQNPVRASSLLPTCYMPIWGRGEVHIYIYIYIRT